MPQGVDRTRLIGGAHVGPKGAVLFEHSPPSLLPEYRSRMSHRRLLCLLASLAACGGGGVAPRSPGPQQSVVRAVDSLAAPWIIRGAERPRAQRVDLTAVLESRSDSLVRVDTVATRAWYDWSEHPDATPRRVTGMVRAFAVRSGGDSLWRVLDAPSLPVSFIAEVPWAGGAPELQLPRVGGCDPQSAIVPGWRDTWVAPPRELSVGTAWRDSSDSPLCRDGIVLRSSAVRDFVVEGVKVANGRMRVVVRRHSRAVITGRGVQFGDSVHFVGSATGVARLELLPDGAIIADGEGSSELRLTMRGRRRTQELVQRSALVIAIP